MKEYVFSSDLYIGFKRIDDAVNDVFFLLEKIAKLLLESDNSSSINSTIFNIRNCVRWDNLIGSQALIRIEILFEDELGVINLHYYHKTEEKDVLDLSILNMVPIKVKKIEVVLITNDMDLANLSGTDNFKNLSNDNIKCYVNVENSEISINSNIEIIEKANPSDFINFSGSNEKFM